MPRRLIRALSTLGSRRGLYALALAAAVAGVVIVVVAVTSQTSPPVPSRSAYGHLNTSTTPLPAAADPEASASPGSRTATTHHPTVPTHQAPATSQSTRRPLELTAASPPTRIDIPAIDVHSEVIGIGKTSDGGLAVPEPGPNLNKAAWYTGSVTPGQPGPSVIEGHIDSIYGPSVFYRLGALAIGDRINVTRADGHVAVFTVNAVRTYPTHDAFPTSVVYGGDLSQPTMRLITCANFDEAIRHYTGNEVVYAHLTALKR